MVDMEIIQRDDGYEVRLDRRVLIDQLDYDEAVLYVEKRRVPDQKVRLIDLEGQSRDITRSLHRARRRR